MVFDFNRIEFDEFLLENNCVGFFEEPITLKSGRPGYYYINVRNVLSTVGLKRKTARFVYDFALSQGYAPDYFLGVPEGATPLAEAVTELIDYRDPFDIPAVILRAKPKDHGDPKDRYSVGALTEGDKVVLLEDITAIGGSVLKCVPGVQEAGVKIKRVIAVANRLERRDDGRTVAEALKEDFDVNYASLTDSSTLVPKAYQKQQPGRKVAENVMNYSKEYGAVEIKL